MLSESLCRLFHLDSDSWITCHTWHTTAAILPAVRSTDRPIVRCLANHHRPNREISSRCFYVVVRISLDWSACLSSSLVNLNFRAAFPSFDVDCFSCLLPFVCLSGFWCALLAICNELFVMYLCIISRVWWCRGPEEGHGDTPSDTPWCDIVGCRGNFITHYCFSSLSAQFYYIYQYRYLLIFILRLAVIMSICWFKKVLHNYINIHATNFNMHEILEFSIYLLRHGRFHIIVNWFHIGIDCIAVLFKCLSL